MTTVFWCGRRALTKSPMIWRTPGLPAPRCLWTNKWRIAFSRTRLRVDTDAEGRNRKCMPGPCRCGICRGIHRRHLPAGWRDVSGPAPATDLVEKLQTKLAVGSTFASSGAADELRKGIAEFADDGGLPQLMARWGYYLPRNLENMVALLKAKRRERIRLVSLGCWPCCLACSFSISPHSPPEEPNQEPASRRRSAGVRRPVPRHGRHGASHDLAIRPREAVYFSQ